MKVCKSCGKSYESGKYCVKCGCELTEENPENNMKSKPKKILILLLVVLILGILTGGSYFLFFAKPDVSLMDEEDCTITFYGTNGKGKADVACMMDPGNYNDFFTTVKYTVKPNENLKNGQTVYVEARYDEESAKHYRIHPVNTSFKTEVEGLKEPVEKPVQEDTTLQFSNLESVEQMINFLKEQGLPISDVFYYDQVTIIDEELEQVVAKAYFEDQTIAGKSSKANAHLSGGTIEICASKQAAYDRLNKVNSIDHHQYMYNYVFGKVYVRLDKALSLEQVQAYEAVFDQMNNGQTGSAKTMRDANF